ncbi:hypothetical protein ABOM_003406 [Aspergillus bombycis]|uniref:Uncharacterized protein n=1 Tax=Aspergillus bombycis TaxID=109264 RepID=A0A1F8A9I7_9EURO|nr:hypothetical protein ABOM_003406 [Aspergillus bombycis]OGM48394.1 hypothetical protein ABOM_003406 [Aspergillus bombycis]
MEIPAEEMPEGWTNDPAMLELYSHPRGSIASIAQWFGLGDIELLMMGTPESGNMQFMIKSGHGYYWGNLMIDDIFEIRKPKTFPEILHALATEGHCGLKYKKVDEIPEGWTNDPIMLEDHSHPSSSITSIAQWYGLGNIKVVLMGTPESGDMKFILMSGGRYYRGNLMTDDIFEITKPKTFPAILHTLARKGNCGLQCRKVDKIPEGWTNDPAILRRYSRPGSSIISIAQRHGLGNVEVVLMGTPESGDIQYIIKSGHGHYWGNLMIDDIFEITKPKTFSAILHTLYRRGDWALTYKKVKQVEDI